MPNCVFADTGDVAALLDFELTGSGPPEVDLGWFLALHRMTVITSGPDLPGFGDRASMLATYEAALGRPVARLRWFEIFAMLRSGSIMVRIARLLSARGVDDSWLTRDNPTASALESMFASEE
jgi:aminoglycoside phosphotransferase (APT) family kinase protein